MPAQACSSHLATPTTVGQHNAGHQTSLPSPDSCKPRRVSPVCRDGKTELRAEGGPPVSGCPASALLSVRGLPSRSRPSLQPPQPARWRGQLPMSGPGSAGPGLPLTSHPSLTAKQSRNPVSRRSGWGERIRKTGRSVFEGREMNPPLFSGNCMFPKFKSAPRTDGPNPRHFNALSQFTAQCTAGAGPLVPKSIRNSRTAPAEGHMGPGGHTRVAPHHAALPAVLTHWI